MAKRKSSNKRKSRGNVRVRAKALSEVDEGKLALAFWLIAKRMVDDQTDQASGENGSAGSSS